MEITLNNTEIINAFNSANELMQCKDLPVKISWDIAKNMKQINDAFNTYLKVEKELIKEYAIKDDNGGVKLDNNNQPKFPPRSEYYSKRNELLECENTLKMIIIKLDNLGGCNISPATLYNLGFMIEE